MNGSSELCKPLAPLLLEALLVTSCQAEASNRAVRIPEILRLVLQNASNRTLAAAARTSGAWSHIALDWLWRELRSFHPILKLLGPLRRMRCDDSHYKWVRYQ